MHKNVAKHFWHKEMQGISCARNPYGISLHPKNPLSKENSVKPTPLGAGGSFLWIFMIFLTVQEQNFPKENFVMGKRAEKYSIGDLYANFILLMDFI